MFRRVVLAALGFSIALSASPQRAAAQEVTAGAGFGAFALEGCPSDLRYLNQLFGWQVTWPRDWAQLRQADDAAVQAAIARWHAAAPSLAGDQQALSATGTIKAPTIVVERVLEQVTGLEAALEQTPALEGAVSAATRQAWNDLFSSEIRPAIAHYEQFLRNDYLPVSSAVAGIGVNAEGVRCFDNAVTRFTTRTLSAAEIEAIGHRLLDETLVQLTALQGRPRSEAPAVLAALRADQYADFTRDDLVATSQAVIARARAAMPQAFSQPVINEVEVSPLPAPMENSFPAGFYRPAEDGGPASYVINLSRPNERRLMAEVIAFHEALPGHHIRVGLGYPEGEFNSGFLEGWAIYAEYLADEMHLYSSDLDRAGMMAKHLWAASRLIVEPGLHVHGWTRDQAVAFMRENTVMSEAEIALEVDRYIAVPGQSLSYMLGYDVIIQARRDAERRLGQRFDLREFHDVVWTGGSRPLDQVADDVRVWSSRVADAGR